LVSRIFFFNKDGKFVENLSVLIDGCDSYMYEGRLEAATSSAFFFLVKEV